jgi:hypothetical protein
MTVPARSSDTSNRRKAGAWGAPLRKIGSIIANDGRVQTPIAHLNNFWFISLDDARSRMEHLHRDYKEVWPHSASGNKPPVAMNHSSPAPPQA